MYGNFTDENLTDLKYGDFMDGNFTDLRTDILRRELLRGVLAEIPPEFRQKVK